MRISYQAAFFANLVDIEANSANTIKILTALKAEGIDLLPTTMQEYSPPTMVPTQRLRFTSADGDIQVNIGTARVDVIQQTNFMVEGPEFGNINAFAELVNKCLKSVLPGNGVLANRLALIVKAVEGELSPNQMHERFKALFNAPAFYLSNAPTEWTFRANAYRDINFSTFSERINTILKIERLQGRAVDSTGAWKEFDRIFNEYDLNTVTGNIPARFTYDDFHQFIETASNVLNDVEGALPSSIP